MLALLEFNLVLMSMSSREFLGLATPRGSKYPIKSMLSMGFGTEATNIRYLDPLGHVVAYQLVGLLLSAISTKTSSKSALPAHVPASVDMRGQQCIHEGPYYAPLFPAA